MNKYGRMLKDITVSKKNLGIEKDKPLIIKTLNGIGDLCWLLTKLKGIKTVYKIPHLTVKLHLAGDHRDGRSDDFIKSFSFVDEVISERFQIFKRSAVTNHILNYIDNEYRDGEFTCILNHHIEWIGRIEDFMPQVPIDWNFLKSEDYKFKNSDTQIAKRLCKEGKVFFRDYKGYLCIHLGCKLDNTIRGMNRGTIWNLFDWIVLISDFIRKSTDLPIYIVGATYDDEYAKELMDLVKKAGIKSVFNLCGRTNVKECIEVLRNSLYTVSFASGIGVASVYMGVPTTIFWRPEKVCISRRDAHRFSDGFATNWAPPNHHYYYPAFYEKDTPKTIFAHIKKMLYR